MMIPDDRSPISTHPSTPYEDSLIWARKKAQEITTSTRNFARERPALVYAGLFLVGLIAARMMKRSRATLQTKALPMSAAPEGVHFEAEEVYLVRMPAGRRSVHHV